MKISKLSILLLLMAALMFGSLTSASAAEKYKLKFYFPGPTSLIEGKFGDWFCKEIEKRSNGRIEAKYFHSGQLGSTMDAIDKLENGIIQGAAISATHASNLDATIGVLALPFLINNFDDADKLRESHLMQPVYNGLKKVGIVGVDVLEFGFYSVAATSPVTGYNQLQKLRLKTRAPDSKMHIAIHKAMGMRPSPMPFGEVYSALHQGVIDGLDTSPEVIKLVKFDEVVKNMYLTQHFYGSQLIWFNQKWLDSLPGDLAVLVGYTVAEGAAKYRKLAREKEVALLKALSSGGVKLVHPTADDLRKFRVATQVVHDEYKQAIGDDYLKQVYKLLGYQQ
jgi:TRAP-type C4-dicarboxylate transport system substrate-binding protein